MLDTEWPSGDDSPQLYNLRVFLAVAAAESIAQASKVLNKAPSAVSRSISELEKSLGVPVFERGTRGIMLNEYGAAVRRRALRIERELNDAAADLSRLKSRGTAPSANVLEHLLYSNRKLEMLIQLVETRKISAAAEHLTMTQSGVSMSLGRMESMLGAKLFYRGLQGITPHEVTGKLAVRARRVFAELRHMMVDIRAMTGTVAGTVIVGALPLGRTTVFPKAISEAISANPGIRVRTVDSPFDELITGLRSGDIDMVVGVPRKESDFSGLVIQPMFLDRLTVVARAGHPLASRKGLSLADLQSLGWILPWHGSPTRRLIDDQFRAAGLRPVVPNVESADLPVIRQLLIASDAIALVSARQMSFELESGLLVELDVPLAGMEREVSLIMREGALLSPVSEVLHAALLRQAQAAV